MTSATEFINFLQSCITPIALISGVGLILLSLTNRLGRTIDRTRSLVAELDKGNAIKPEVKITELRILYRRSRILRMSIASISLSILTSSLIIPVLLAMTLSGIDLKIFGMLLFVCSMICIILSAVFLLADVVLTLRALDHEVKDYIDIPDPLQ